MMIHKMMISTILVLLCPSALAVKFSLPRFLAGLGLTAAVTGATIAGDDLVTCDVPTMTQRPVATCQLVGKTEPTYEVHPTTRGRNDDPGRSKMGQIHEAQDIYMCNNIIPKQVPVCEMKPAHKNMCKKKGSRYACTDGTTTVVKCGIRDVPCRTSVTSPATPTETKVSATKSPAPKAKVVPTKGNGSVTAPSSKLAAAQKVATACTSDAKLAKCTSDAKHTWTSPVENLDSVKTCEWNRPAKSATCDSWCKIECSTTNDKCCGGLPACKGCSFCGSVTAAAAKDKTDISGAIKKLFNQKRRFEAGQPYLGWIDSPEYPESEAVKQNVEKYWNHKN